MKKTLSNTFLLLAGVFAVNHHATAQLQPLDDAQMEQTVGQAYIKMDSRLEGVDKFSRITFGQSVKIQANADNLTLGGNYDNALGLGSGTDFNASNISLGYIDTTTNTIVPFEFENPYIEWAVNDVTNDMIGFRIGFEDAKGVLQGDFSRFSGNIGMTINNQAASLFTGAGGGITNNRATHIGNNLDGNNTCDLGSDCVALSNIQSLAVGDSAEADGKTADFFLAFQKTALDWGQGPVTNKGFFMNIPTTTNLDVSNSSSGTGRLATEFIDRGIGRWNVPAP